ncbi:MAG: PIN domain-containing protein [Betaproteobacteria bacterium]|nr:PIN domain-containing protein [Betaproteobacteria bacterium]
MRIYLDACSFQRPLDDRSQPRINIEAEAVLTILQLIESGHLELLSSEVLRFEIDRIPNQYRKEQATEMLKLAAHLIELNDEIEVQADKLVKTGVKPLDALHLASASWAKADYFCTCDDKLLKKHNILKGIATEVVSPLQLVAEVAP